MFGLSQQQRKRLLSVGIICFSVAMIVVALTGALTSIETAKAVGLVMCLLATVHFVVRILIWAVRVCLPSKFPNPFPDIRYLASVVTMVGTMVGVAVGVFFASIFH